MARQPIYVSGGMEDEVCRQIQLNDGLYFIGVGTGRIEKQDQDGYVTNKDQITRVKQYIIDNPDHFTDDLVKILENQSI